MFYVFPLSFHFQLRVVGHGVQPRIWQAVCSHVLWSGSRIPSHVGHYGQEGQTLRIVEGSIAREKDLMISQRRCQKRQVKVNKTKREH